MNPEDAITTHTQSLAGALRALERELSRLTELLLAPHALAPGIPLAHVHYVPRDDGAYHTRSDAPARRALIGAYAQITYLGDEERNRTPDVYGALCAPTPVLDQARRANAAKSAFRAAIAAIPRRSVQVAAAQPSDIRPTRKRWLRSAVLARIGAGRVNTLAALREIPIVAEPLRVLSHHEARTRSVPRRTVAALADALADHPGPWAQEDLARLARLDPKEYLVGPKRHYRRMRAQGLPARAGAAPITLCADLPLIVLATARHGAPIFRAPAGARTAPRARRTLMEDEPTVRTLGYHRMQVPHRRYAR